MRGGLILLIFTFGVLLMGVIAAENHTAEGDILDEAIEEHEDAVFDTDPGLNPDSFFYFIDEIFDSCSIENKEEKIAEIEAMIEAGNNEAAREAFNNYEKCSLELEEEIDPDERDAARESAASIARIANGLGEFGDNILDNEEKLLISVEISSKIKELCEALSELDPVAYAQTCKTDDNAPAWQKRLDEDLTDEQREEAKKFGRIMSECFKTSGQQCRCDEIPFTDFAEMCSIAAPLAVQCDIRNNEAACEKLDNLEMPELPEHLQDVFDDLEDDLSDSQFDNHAPQECVEAGATTRSECERIMFDLYAPQECIDAGATTERECGRIMFSINAPQECIDAGLIGDDRNDRRACENIMRSLEGARGDRNFEGYGADCSVIQNSQERLACYDGALGDGGNDFNERYESIRESERQCRISCDAEGGAWDFSGGNCECYTSEFDFDFEEEFDGGFDDGGFNDFKDIEESPYDCSSLDCGPLPTYCDPYQGCVEGDDGFNPDGSSCDEGYEWDGSGCIPFGTGDYGFENNCPEGQYYDSNGACTSGSDESTTTPEPESDTIGTGAIITGNVFLDYYYR